MAWIPISPEKLKVGLYIKLDHKWTEYPFLRNKFKITSTMEISVIRKNGLTKIFYDPNLSDPKSLLNLDASIPLIKEDVAEVEKADSALRSLKEEKIKTILTHQESLKHTEQAFDESVQEGRLMLRMISAGQPEGLALATQQVESLINLMENQSVAISFVNMMKPADIADELCMHAVTMANLSLLVGKNLALNQEDLKNLGVGARLYNIGLTRIPQTVRMKKEPLTSAERSLMELYPQWGREMAREIPGMTPDTLKIIHQHQENVDGSGYPQGLKGDATGLLPKIVRVVTEYHALLHNRTESGERTPTEALAYLYSKMKGKCAPNIVESFIATVTVYPPGTLVRLTDETIGLVVKSNEHDRMRPLVMVYESGVSRDETTILDLSMEKECAIRESLNPSRVDPHILSSLAPGPITGYLITPIP